MSFACLSIITLLFVGLLQIMKIKFTFKKSCPFVTAIPIINSRVLCKNTFDERYIPT